MTSHCRCLLICKLRKTNPTLIRKSVNWKKCSRPHTNTGREQGFCPPQPLVQNGNRIPGTGCSSLPSGRKSVNSPIDCLSSGSQALKPPTKMMFQAESCTLMDMPVLSTEGLHFPWDIWRDRKWEALGGRRRIPSQGPQESPEHARKPAVDAQVIREGQGKLV